MKAAHRQSGVTLTEMLVVVAIMVLLVGLGTPAVKTFFNTFESHGSTRAMISAALASARAIAAKEQSYAGIRFQTAYNPDNPSVLNADQYMIFIVYDFDATGLAYGFRAIEKLKPIKLPQTIGVMDPVLIEQFIEDALPDDWEPTTEEELLNLTAFSIIFSPSGKLVTHDVRVRKVDFQDNVFNTPVNVSNGTGMFIEDEDNDGILGLVQESSRKSFIIYDKKEFRYAFEQGDGYSDHLAGLITLYINRYTGRIISAD